MGTLTDYGSARQFDSDGLEQVIRDLPARVVVVTAGYHDEITGATVSSFLSLPGDRTTVVVVLSRQSRSWELVEKRGVFGANILAADQAAIAEQFSGRGGMYRSPRSISEDWFVLVSGVPLLRGARAVLDCEAENVVHRTSHVIVVGRVLESQVSAGRGALAYRNDGYAALAECDRISERRQVQPLAVVNKLS